MDRATSQQNNSACAGAQKASIDSSGLQSEWACPQFFGACGVAQGICQPENEIQGARDEDAISARRLAAP